MYDNKLILLSYDSILAEVISSSHFTCFLESPNSIMSNNGILNGTVDDDDGGDECGGMVLLLQELAGPK